MLASIAVAMLFAGCIGAGAATLAGLGVLNDLRRAERLAWSFAIGLGVLGWVTFFPAVAGLIAPVHLFILCAVAAAGLYFLVRSNTGPRQPLTLDWAGRALCAAIALALAFDLLEGLSPPADGDSLAYHFALPKQFLAAGRLEFVPRAADGAAPLLLHMGYMLALGMGGESALTLWTMLSGWMASLLVFALCRRFLDVNWSLAVALIFLTTPAVLYGAGSGQAETRLVLFALTAMFAAARACRADGFRFVILAGLAAGFFAGAKFTGLIFVLACGLPLLVHRQWLARGAVYGIAATIAGGEWYGWNWLHTGDPLFPMLHAWLGLPDSDIWNARQAAFFQRAYFGTEAPLSKSLAGFISYPFQATLSGIYALESGRTGFGPYGLLALPFAALGVFAARRRLAPSELMVPAVIVVIFYAVWFFTGSSQRVRHLLPVYPVVLMCVTVAARGWIERKEYGRPLVAAVALTVAIQLAGHSVFAANYARHVFLGEDRSAFLLRNVKRFESIAWINRNLAARDKVLLNERQLVYLARVPVFYVHPQMQAQIEVRPDSTDPARFLRQLKQQGVTHLLIPSATGANADEKPAPDPITGTERLAYALEQAGCARQIKIFDMNAPTSRTLPTLGVSRSRLRLLAIQPGACAP